MSLASDSAAEVLAALQYAGSSMTLTRTTPGAYDNATGATGSASSTNYTIQAVMTNYRDALIDGTLILAGDRKALIAASGLAITPAVGDRIVNGSETSEIVKSSEIAPNGTPVAYIAQVRS